VFTTAWHWSLSWARCIQSTPSHPTSLRSILILSSHLRIGLAFHNLRINYESGQVRSNKPPKLRTCFLLFISRCVFALSVSWFSCVCKQWHSKCDVNFGVRAIHLLVTWLSVGNDRNRTMRILAYKLHRMPAGTWLCTSGNGCWGVNYQVDGY